MRGRRLPVLGVTMEHTTLDLTGIENPQIGEIITLLGKDTNEVITFSRDVHDNQLMRARPTKTNSCAQGQ